MALFGLYHKSDSCFFEVIHNGRLKISETNRTHFISPGCNQETDTDSKLPYPALQNSVPSDSDEEATRNVTEDRAEHPVPTTQLARSISKRIVAFKFRRVVQEI